MSLLGTIFDTRGNRNAFHLHALTRFHGPPIAPAYRILGLPPGSPRDEVKQAYRDLAQVWHPDRFAHNDRLREKAERNFARINDAFEALKDREPEDQVRESRLSMTFSAIVDMGDVLQSRDIQRGLAERGAPVSHRGRDVVLGIGDHRATSEYARKRQRSGGWWVWVVVAVLVGAAMVAVFLIR